MFIYGGLKECTDGTKHRINGTQAVKYSEIENLQNEEDNIVKIAVEQLQLGTQRIK